MKNEKKKSLGTVLSVILVAAAFVAAVSYGTNTIVRAIIAGGDPFWILFGMVVWGGIAAWVWLVGCLIWEDQI